MDTKDCAKGRYEWAAAGILWVPFASLIVLLSEVGAGLGVLLGVTMIFGIPAYRLRKARGEAARATGERAHRIARLSG